LLELTKHFKTSADDNHATYVNFVKFEFIQTKNIQKSVRFACIIELSFITHKRFRFSSNSLSLTLESVLFRSVA